MERYDLEGLESRVRALETSSKEQRSAIEGTYERMLLSDNARANVLDFAVYMDEKNIPYKALGSLFQFWVAIEREYDAIIKKICADTVGASNLDAASLRRLLHKFRYDDFKAPHVNMAPMGPVGPMCTMAENDYRHHINLEYVFGATAARVSTDHIASFFKT